MSKTTKNKYVIQEVQKEHEPLKASEQVVQIIAPAGNNLHEVRTIEDVRFLVSMPTRFRNLTYVKKGDFIVVEPIEEGDRVRGEIVRLLDEKHIKAMQVDGTWPKEFDSFVTNKKSSDYPLPPSYDDEDDDNDDDNVASGGMLINNPNRPSQVQYSDSSEESDTSQSDHDDVEMTAKDSELSRK